MEMITLLKSSNCFIWKGLNPLQSDSLMCFPCTTCYICPPSPSPAEIDLVVILYCLEISNKQRVVNKECYYILTKNSMFETVSSPLEHFHRMYENSLVCPVYIFGIFFHDYLKRCIERWGDLQKEANTSCVQL